MKKCSLIISILSMFILLINSGSMPFFHDQQLRQLDTIKCFSNEFEYHSIIYTGTGCYNVWIKGYVSDDKVVKKWGDCYYSNALSVKIYQDSTQIINQIFRKSDFIKYVNFNWNTNDYLINNATIMQVMTLPFCITIAISISIPDSGDGVDFLLKVDQAGKYTISYYKVIDEND